MFKTKKLLDIKRIQSDDYIPITYVIEKISFITIVPEERVKFLKFLKSTHIQMTEALMHNKDESAEHDMVVRAKTILEMYNELAILHNKAMKWEVVPADESSPEW